MGGSPKLFAVKNINKSKPNVEHNISLELHVPNLITNSNASVMNQKTPEIQSVDFINKKDAEQLGKELVSDLDISSSTFENQAEELNHIPASNIQENPIANISKKAKNAEKRKKKKLKQ